MLRLRFHHRNRRPEDIPGPSVLDSAAMLLHSKPWMRKLDRAVWYAWAVLGIAGAIALGFGLTLK